MAKAIKISLENYKKICTIAKKERRSRKTIIDIAIENYPQKISEK